MSRCLPPAGLLLAERRGSYRRAAASGPLAASGRPPRAAGEASLNEAFVARLWRAQRFARAALRTVEGFPLEVVYPGRRRGERGPDFQDALLVFAATELRRGGVEVHLRSSDWVRHGHHHDPAYNTTLLHVVLWHDVREPLRRQDGALLPTLALAGYLEDAPAVLAATLPADPGEWPLTERGACGPDAASVGQRLEAAGLARFAAWRARYESELTVQSSAAALLCTGLIEATGFGANREPARVLAATLPYPTLRAAAAAGDTVLEALLLGAAGLLPSQRGLPPDSPAVAALEAAWRQWRGNAPPPLTARHWRFHGVRPASYPPRRLAGLARLLARQPPERLLAAAAQALRTRAPRPAARALAELLVVRAEEGYWRDHWDFGRASARPLPALLGPERAAEMVVNVLLPLLAAWGEALGDAALTAAAVTCYQQHPPTGDNERLRHMRRQVLGGASRAVIATACRQQGLLHIYQQTCGWRRCEGCVIGPPAAGRG
ncbi:MAG TPA: DUF2851 family protein [Chloroflexota bacterium]|nr:DUF2851 family protein [Chloroflexota bacterium]